MPLIILEFRTVPNPLIFGLAIMLRKCEKESAAFVGLAFDPDTAVMCFNQMATNG